MNDERKNEGGEKRGRGIGGGDEKIFKAGKIPKQGILITLYRCPESTDISGLASWKPRSIIGSGCWCWLLVLALVLVLVLVLFFSYLSSPHTSSQGHRPWALAHCITHLTVIPSFVPCHIERTLCSMHLRRRREPLERPGHGILPSRHYGTQYSGDPQFQRASPIIGWAIRVLYLPICLS